MKKEKDYIQDIAEIRSMMERTSKFLSLSGWAGIMAGIYALAGAFVAWKILNFHPVERLNAEYPVDRMTDVVIVAIIILSLAIFTAIIDSSRRARTRGETVWNSASKRLLISMSVPLVAGGILILILLSQGFVGLVLPLSLIFYGLALYNAGNFTFKEVRILGYTEILLGLTCSCFPEYGLLFWSAGFGLAHIIYGIYMQTRYRS